MVDLLQIWGEVLVNLDDTVPPECINTIRQAVVSAIGKYEVTPKVECTEIATYDEDKRGYTMFFCAKGVEGLSKRTLQYYKLVIDNYLNFINKPLKSITTNDIRFYLAQRSTRDGVSMVTMENERRILNVFFGWLAEEDYIDKNVCKPVKKIKTKKVKKKAFTETEIQKIKDACLIKGGYMAEEKLARSVALVEFLISTGCRAGEIAQLKRQSVDVDNSCATVVGKGNKERVVYLTQVCKMRLQEYWELAGKREYTFAGLGTDKPLSVPGIEITIRELGKLAGVENCHPHRFRRTCATMALKKGMTIVDVQRMLGHENLDTTKIYLDLDDSDLAYQHAKVFG